MSGLLWADIISLLAVLVLTMGLVIGVCARMNAKIERNRTESSEKIAAVHKKIDENHADSLPVAHFEQRIVPIMEQIRHVLEALRDTNARLDNLIPILMGNRENKP